MSVCVCAARLPTGGEYLYQARDDTEMNQWVAAIEEVCAALGGAAAAPAKSSKTLPASSHDPEPKKRSFFTLKKK